MRQLPKPWVGQRQKNKKTPANKGPSSKAMVFPVVMYGCESWTINRKLSTEELMLLKCGVGEDS